LTAILFSRILARKCYRSWGAVPVILCTGRVKV
jgi:hypothetical protein